MDTRYFRAMATDNLPGFEPLGQWAGAWFGVVAVNDEEVLNKLIANKNTELSEAEYNEELKKKQELPQHFQPLRHVPQSLGRVAQPAETAAKSVPANSIEAPIIPAPTPAEKPAEQSASTPVASPLPTRRGSQQKPA